MDVSQEGAIRRSLYTVRRIGDRIPATHGHNYYGGFRVYKPLQLDVNFGPLSYLSLDVSELTATVESPRHLVH